MEEVEEDEKVREQVSFGRWSRRAVVVVLLSAACLSTLALWVKDDPHSRRLLQLNSSEKELKLANDEIREYDSQLRIGRAPVHLRSVARQTELWNAAANDEVHLVNGRLTQAVAFPEKIHAVDENPDDEKSEEADASKMRDIVEAAGSTTKALAKALKEEEHLKAKLRLEKELAKEGQVQRLDLKPKSSAGADAKALKNKAAVESPAEQIVEEIAEDPAKLVKCLNWLQEQGATQAEALSKCIATLKKEKDTEVTTYTKVVETDSPGEVNAAGTKQIKQQALVTRSDVPRSQWENISEWGPAVVFVEQARAETQNMPAAPGLGKVPESLQKFVAESNALQTHNDAPLLDYSDTPAAEVQAWQNFAAHLQGASGEAYMAHLEKRGTEADARQIEQSAASDAGAGAGAGNNLFWDIVKGRKTVTVPPPGDFSQITGTIQKQQLGDADAASQFPPQCPNQDPRKDQCNGSGEGCELCVSENGYCKPTGGSISVSKIQGKGSLADYYYLNIMGEVGHPLHVVLRGSDGYTKSWEEFSSLWSDKIHKPGSSGRAAGTIDHLQVQDLSTGDIAFFRFPCAPDAAQLTAPPASVAALPPASAADAAAAGVAAGASAPAAAVPGRLLHKNTDFKKTWSKKETDRGMLRLPQRGGMRKEEGSMMSALLKAAVAASDRPPLVVNVLVNHARKVSAQQGHKHVTQPRAGIAQSYESNYLKSPHMLPTAAAIQEQALTRSSLEQAAIANVTSEMTALAAFEKSLQQQQQQQERRPAADVAAETRAQHSVAKSLQQQVVQRLQEAFHEGLEKGALKEDIKEAVAAKEAVLQQGLKARLARVEGQLRAVQTRERESLSLSRHNAPSRQESSEAAQADARGAAGAGVRDSLVSALQLDSEVVAKEAREEPLSDGAAAGELPRKFSEEAIQRLVRRQERAVVEKQVHAEVKKRVQEEVLRQEREQVRGEEEEEEALEGKVRAIRQLEHTKLAPEDTQGLQGQRGAEAAAGPLRRDVQSLQAANSAMVDAVNADVSRELQQGLASGMGGSSGAGSDAFAARERLERRRQVSSRARRDAALINDASGEEAY